MTSATPAERRLIRATIAELERQYIKGREGPYTYMGLEDLDNTDDFEIGIDGHTYLLALVRAISRAGARLADDPPEHGCEVLAQYKLRNVYTVLTCQGPAFFDHSRKIWVNRQTSGDFTIECWWEYPELLSEQQLCDIGPGPEPVQDPMPDAVALYLLEKVHGGACPKCRQLGGNSWGDCQGSCPIPGSPHHNDAETMRQFLRSLRS